MTASVGLKPWEGARPRPRSSEERRPHPWEQKPSTEGKPSPKLLASGSWALSQAAVPRPTPCPTLSEPRLLSSEARSASRGPEEEPRRGHGQPCLAGSAAGWGLGGGPLASREVRTLPAHWGVRGRFPTLFVLAVSLGARVPSEVCLFLKRNFIYFCLCWVFA